MSSFNLIESFKNFKEAENIDRPTLMKVLEDVFKTLIRKKHGTDENFDVIVNDQTGDLEIIRRRKVVEDGFSEDDNLEVELAEANAIDPDAGYEVGEEIFEEIDVMDFGRRAIMAAKQTLSARLKDIRNNEIIEKYADRVGDLVTGEVYQHWRKEVMLIDEEGTELILPKQEQIPGDFFKKGEFVRAVIKKVELKNNQPVIIVSRAHSSLLEKLMELEVPEIGDGQITIKKIVREPGERAKVIVESYDERIDPVGACVGVKGSRIHGIVRELKNENIDIINSTNNLNLLVQRSLTPARVNRLKIDDEKKHIDVYMDSDQVSLAIGRKGANIKLAQQLLGYSIDVYRDIKETAEFDIDIQEFSDEIDQWIIDEFKKVGFDTALSILDVSVDDLSKRTDLEEETIRNVRKILEDEFDNEEDIEEEDDEQEDNEGNEDNEADNDQAS